MIHVLCSFEIKQSSRLYISTVPYFDVSKLTAVSVASETLNMSVLTS